MIVRIRVSEKTYKTMRRIYKDEDLSWEEILKKVFEFYDVCKKIQPYKEE